MRRKRLVGPVQYCLRLYKAKIRICGFFLAETQGFEPWRRITLYLVSSEALSTTQPRLLHFIQSTWLRVLLGHSLRMNAIPLPS